MKDIKKREARKLYLYGKPSEPGRWSIHKVSAETGIPESTLRAWRLADSWDNPAKCGKGYRPPFSRFNKDSERHGLYSESLSLSGQLTRFISPQLAARRLLNQRINTKLDRAEAMAAGAADSEKVIKLDAKLKAIEAMIDEQTLSW